MSRDSAVLRARDDAASVSPASRKQLLLVEDESGIADFVARALRAEGYAVTHVSDGSRGRRLGEAGMFDLVILDWRIPGETGSAVLDALSASSADLPIIVMSASDEAARRLVSSYTESVRFIAKPFAVSDLLRAVHELLAHDPSSAGRELAHASNRRARRLGADASP
jgi:two-component system, OmpR family, catabolic regulation response regulator CreB